jgi:hypothetical protein
MLCMWEDTDGRFCDRYTELAERNLFFSMTQQPKSDLGHLTVEVSK